MPTNRTVYVAYTNTDTTEGRGADVPFAVCELESTALRLAKNQYVQGSDGPVAAIDLEKIGGVWYAPLMALVVVAPTPNDVAVQKLKDDRRAAIVRAKALGVTDYDIQLLKS